MSHVRVRVDRYELRSGVPSALRALEVDVEVGLLTIGDYDVGGGTLIERKTTADLFLSLQNGRLWRQIGALRRECRFPVLLVEGEPSPMLKESAFARGFALAIADQGIVLLSSASAIDSGRWIADLAQRRQLRVPRYRPPYSYRSRSPRGRPGEALLCAVDGISVHHARSLLKTFGSVRGVVRASRCEWLAVRGIGPARADALAAAFGPHD